MRKGLLFLFLPLLAPVAYACSCAMVPVPSAFQKTPLVFIGRVTSQQLFIEGRAVEDKPGRLMNPGEYQVYFSVIAILKGPPTGDAVVIRTPNQGPACGFKFETGSEYLVFAGRDPKTGLWWTSQCSYTHKIKFLSGPADELWLESMREHGLTGTRPPR